MQTKRQFITSGTALIATPALQGCSGSSISDVAKTAASLRVPIPMAPEYRDFIRFATLAPNGHNTQAWKFKIQANKISILPDMTRRTKVVDPDDHHIYVSLGCAEENLCLAAAANGRPCLTVFRDEGEGRIDIDLAKGPAVATDLYGAIPKRQSTRSVYDGRPVSTEHLRALEAAASIDGVSMTLITDAKQRSDVLDFVVEGNSAQMDDPAFVNELKRWIRFNPGHALKTRDGLYGPCSGSDTSVPAWIGRPMFGQFFEKDAENEKYVQHVKSSSGIAVFIGDRSDRDHWVRVGRSFQRFALKATALGIRHAHINQPIEVPSVRSAFANWLGIPGQRPDLVIRFGYAPPMPMSLRRTVDAVIIK